MNNRSIAVIGVSFLCAALSGPAIAANAASNSSTSTHTSANKEMKGANETVREATKLVQKLKANPETKKALMQAKAVFLVPEYGRAAFGIGGAGGEGVLIAKHNGKWSDPAFYNIGSASLGLQAGVEGGSIAFMIMSDRALKGFREKHNFSLNADAGLTVVNWSKRGQYSAGEGADVIAWSNTKGLYGDLAVSVTDIAWDGDANKAYYQKTATAREIIDGNMQTPESGTMLKSEFSALETGTSSGQTAPTKGQYK